MSSPVPVRTLSGTYAEAYSGYVQSLKLLLLGAAASGGRMSKGQKLLQHDALHALSNTHEILTLINGMEPQGGDLVFPFTPEGLEFYMSRFGLTGEQRAKVGEFFAAMGEHVGGDVFGHLSGAARHWPKSR